MGFKCVRCPSSWGAAVSLLVAEWTVNSGAAPTWRGILVAVEPSGKTIHPPRQLARRMKNTNLRASSGFIHSLQGPKEASLLRWQLQDKSQWIRSRALAGTWRNCPPVAGLHLFLSQHQADASTSPRDSEIGLLVLRAWKIKMGFLCLSLFFN